MNVITPGYTYEIETSDLTAHPTGLQTIQFKKDDDTTPVLGVISSHEIIDMMIDRYLHLAEYDESDDLVCSINYILAAKAEKIVKGYVPDETQTP